MPNKPWGSCVEDIDRVIANLEYFHKVTLEEIIIMLKDIIKDKEGYIKLQKEKLKGRYQDV